MAVVAADWRNAGAYDRLLPGDPRCFAWDWLRRTPAYVETWKARRSPAPFGLVRLEDPAVDAFAARPIWSAMTDAGVLRAIGRSAEGGDRLSFETLAPFVTAAALNPGFKHILLSDGLRSIRIDLRAESSLDKEMALSWHLTGISRLARQLNALAQFRALARLRRFSLTLHPTASRAARWTAMLRVHDAIAAGATNREIVAVLFGLNTSAARWRADASSWRLRVQRLAAGAREHLALGPAAWLGNEQLDRHDGVHRS